MHILPKKLVLYVSFLTAVVAFSLVSECNAQRGLGRLPFRQQQIENRVRQISPQEPASEQKPTPAAEEKAKETPAPAVNENEEKAPAPAVKEKAEETPAPAVKEKAEEAPAPAVEEKAEEAPAPAVEEKAEEAPAPEAKKKTEKKPKAKKKAEETPAPEVKEKAEETPEAEEASILENDTFPPVNEKKASDPKEVSPDSLHEKAVEKVLADPDVPEEAKKALKQATKEDIQKSVEEATAEVEADNQNEHIDGVVENSRREVDEDSIENAVNEVLDSSEETLNEELKKSQSAKVEEEMDDSLPDSIDQIIDGLGSEEDAKETAEETEKTAEVEEDDADDDDDDADDADDDDDDDAAGDSEDEPKEAANETEETEAQPNAKMVKMADLDQELKVPENATFEQLHEFLVGLDSIGPEDLDRTNQEIMMTQAKTFLEKVFQAKLAASDQMLALEGLTDEQWKEAVSWKVQSLANLFRIDGSKIDEMRKFVKEVQPKAPKDISWTLESILIQMELAQITEEPTPEELKSHVNQMLEHTKKGIEENCASQDFVLATVQMVVLTEDSLPKEESKEIFESAIKTLNSSEDPKLQEMAKFLQKLLDQREIVGKTPDLTLETYDGKTVKTADFVGKTLLIYCFQMSSRDQLQDLGLVYQIYLAFHGRGLEVIGIVPEEKTDAMDELLQQIPWPMVFEGKNAENSAVEKLCVPTFPTKVLVNAEGKIENANVQPMELLKYLEAVYGPVSKSSNDEEAKDAEEKEESDETEAIEPPADEEEDAPEADADADDESPEADADADDESPEAEADEDETPETPAESVKKVKEKAEEKAKDLIDELELDLDL